MRALYILYKLRKRTGPFLMISFVDHWRSGGPFIKSRIMRPLPRVASFLATDSLTLDPLIRFHGLPDRHRRPGGVPGLQGWAAEREILRGPRQQGPGVLQVAHLLLPHRHRSERSKSAGTDFRTQCSKRSG